MKKFSLFSISLLSLIICLSSCSTTEFMKRKYMPGRFYNSPVSKEVSRTQHSEKEKSISEEITQVENNNVISVPSDQGSTIDAVPEKTSLLGLARDIRTMGSGKFIKELVNNKGDYTFLKKEPAPLSFRGDRKKGMGWLSFIFGILTFAPVLYSSILFALLAIIFGLITFKRVNEDSSKYGGKFLAFLGMFLGILGVLLIVLGVIATIA